MTSTSFLVSHDWLKQSCFDDEKFERGFYNDLAEVAGKELREDHQTRQQCVKQFREWIEQNQDIENCKIDDGFLLRFLRVKKFSLPMAQQTLLKYLNFRKRFKHIFNNLDYKDPKVFELISNGYIFVSPLRDSVNRRVIITNLNKFDPYKYTSADMARAHAITYETLIEDEENQILGVVHVGSGEGASPAYVGIWSITEFATLLKWGEQSFPMRHKACHAINIPTPVKYVVDFALSRLSQKLKDRLHMYTSKNELIKHLSPEILPEEYGGVMSTSVMVELWKKELEAKRERLLSYDDMNLLSDQGIIKRKNRIVENEINGLQGSFRKLEVD